MRNLRRLIAALVAFALAPTALAAQQPATITGTVVDEGGRPISGASVFLPSLNVGTVTRENGTYTLIVPASRLRTGSVGITAQNVGFRSQSATVTLQAGGAVTQDFRLGLDVLELEGIVATGQGTVTTRERAVSTINTVRAEEVSRAKETNIVAALSGKAPNVNITSSSGDPGAGAYIQIRGAASVEGTTQPLFVVDGTPVDNSSDQIFTYATEGTANTNRAADINPNDIERIEILKGAAATAIYGARGANGVVLITTKGGRAGETRATLSTTYSHDEVTNLPDLQTTYGQGSAGRPSVTSSMSWGPRLEAGTPVFDHAGGLFTEGNKLESNLTLSGGSERTTYFLSVGRLDHNGVIVGENDSYVRNSARLKGTHFVRDDLQIGGNFAYTESDMSAIQQGSNISGILLGEFRTPPNFNNCPADVNPCYVSPTTGLHRSYRLQNPTTILQSRGYDNPYFVINEQTNTADVGRAFGNVSLDYTPASWLRISYLLGGDYISDERLSLRPKSSSGTPGRTGDIIRANIVRQIWDSNLLATATGEIASFASGSLTIGQNLNQTKEWWNQVNGANLILGAEETDFAVDVIGDEYKYTTRNDGYFVTGETTFWDQLTLTATGRWDGSSTFGGDGERFFYPGVGASWVFTNGGLTDGLGFLNFGKLRGSFGVSGRQPPVFSNVSAFTTGTFNDSWVSTGLESIYRGNEGVFTQGTLGNENIEPERKEEWEIGTDLAFLDSRLSLGVTYYDRKTTDAILQVPVPVSTGYANKYANAAAFENHGWEVTLDVNPVRSRNLNWSINAQYGRNESCVTDIAGASDFFLGGFSVPYSAVVAPNEDGSCNPFGVLFGDDFVRFGRGIEVDGVDIDAAFPNAAEGALYIGEDGFPVYDEQFRVIGDPNPDWTAGIRNTITIANNLTISGLIDIKQGGDMWNGTKGALAFFGTAGFTEPYHGEGKTEVIGQTYLPQKFDGPGAGKSVKLDQSWFTSNLGSGFTGPSQQFVEDASYVKLRDVSVSYTLDQPWVGRLGFSTMDLTVSGRNLKTWTDYTGIDPESNLTGQTGALGNDYFNNPQTRSFVFTVNLNR